jgi:hypothetical protein
VQDPRNRHWRAYNLTVRLRVAMLLSAQGNVAESWNIVNQTRDEIQTLAGAEPTVRRYQVLMATFWMLESRLQEHAGVTNGLPSVERVLQICQPFLSVERLDPKILWEVAGAHLIAGRILRNSGHMVDAEHHWTQVIELLTPQLARSPNNWRLLDPLARAHIESGHRGAAEPLIQRLRALGYHPADPLAASLLGLPF